MKNSLFVLILISCHSFAKVLPVAIKPEPTLPTNIVQQLPKGYKVMTYLAGELNEDKLLDYLVVASKKNEQATFEKTGAGSPRPLFIFIQSKNGTFLPVKRNDDVVFAINAGGQCDPFDDSDERLVIARHYFTVQNSVACGQHWDDFITFRYDMKRNNWLFHQRSSESWRLNDSDDPKADALVSDSANVTKANPKKPILFETYKP